MNKLKSPQARAHDVIRLNRLLGLKGRLTITQAKIEKYRTNFPNNGVLIENILNFLYLPMGTSLLDVCKMVSFKSKYNTSEVAKMFLHVVESVLLCEKRVGKQLSLKPLINFSKKNGSVLCSTQINKLENNQFESKGKRFVWSEIVRILKSSKSPKKGEVLTLANLFQFEKLLIKIPDFGFTFSSCENSYAVYQKQLEIWQNSSSFRKRIESPRFGDITSIIKTYKDNSLSHIFADFCGQYANDIEDFTKYVLSNRIVNVGGIIWFTYQNRSVIGRRNIPKMLESVVKQYGKGNYIIEKVGGENVYGYVGHQNNPEDGRTGAKMITLIVRRVK